MESARGRGAGRSFLAYFGLETREKAGAVLFWAAPYLLLLGGGLVGLSFAVQWVFPLSLWVHGVALVLGLGYFFLFLARLRCAVEAAGRDEGEGEARGGGRLPPDRKG